MADKSVAIAFGGGGARGLSHIWVIEAFDELGVKPVALSGASIGALAAICYASGISGADLRAYALEVFSKSSVVVSRFWKNRPRSFSEFWTMPSSMGNWAQFDPEWVAQTFLPKEIKSHFGELDIPTSLAAADYFTGEEIILNEGAIMPAMAASMAIPALFRPVQLGERTLVDGGCVNPMPIDHVRPRADIVVAVDVVGLPKMPDDGKLGTFEMGFGATQILMQTIQREKMRHDRVDLLVHPHIGDFRPLDFLKAKDILEASKNTKEEVKRSLAKILEA